MSYYLKRKRNRSLDPKNNDHLISAEGIRFKRNCKISPDSKIITFIDVEGQNITITIKSKFELEKKLAEYKFTNPYYLDKNSNLKLLNNIGDFFHLKEVDSIYNFPEYINNITEAKFNEQFNSIANDILKDDIYINEFFMERKEYYKYHTPKYEYILFMKYDIQFYDMREICCSSEKLLRVVEIFKKNKIGFTTFIYIFYSQLRTRIRKNERFIPFIIFDFLRIMNLREYQELIDCLFYYITNLFTIYEPYNKFCSSVYEEIKKYGFNVQKIILKTIKLYIEYIKKQGEMGYVPCIIIDNYSPIYVSFYNKLLQLQDKYNNAFRIIFVYNLDNNLANKALLDYLIKAKKSDFRYKYCNNLYYGISYLPNKYTNIFKEVIPNINNYLSLNMAKDEEDAKKIQIEEEKEIKKGLLEFYDNDGNQMNLYLNEINILIGKELDLNNEFYKNIFLNLPLNYFNLEYLENKKIKFNYNGKDVEKIVYNICSESILDIFIKLNKLNIDNFVKGGIFERGIREILCKKNPIFGKIGTIVDFDCLLNVFRTKIDYSFTDEEINSKLKHLESIVKLKKKHSNYKFINKTMIIQKQNGKDWDLAILGKEENNDLLNLCLLQISINKTIEEVIEILKYLDKKEKFIRAKIEEVLNIKINNTHILFVFLSQTQKIKTVWFLRKYGIPYIFYDIDSQNFIYENLDIINHINLNESTSFENNYKKWKKALEDKEIKTKNIIKIIFANNDDLEEEKSNILYRNNNHYQSEEIINNKDLILFK